MGLDQESAARLGGHVFVSYARTDRDRVKPIVDAIEARGQTVWWDHRLAGGSTFAHEIETNLRSAKAVIVVWSNTSVTSDWVRDEAAMGRDLGRLVPIRLDDVPPPLGFGQYHSVNFSRWNGRADADEISQLIAALDADARGRNTPSGPPPATRSLSLPRRTALIGAAAIPIALAGFWFLGGRKLIGGGAPEHSVAVLPFANLSNDIAQDYFSDGLTEELINALARLPSLQVAGRTSSFTFKNRKDNTTDIAAKLGVAFLVDGSVRRQADQVRISVELIDARTGFQRWAQTYDHDMSDILATQSGIAQSVAEQLKGTLLAGDISALSAGGTSTPKAYDAYLQGRKVFDQGGDESQYRAALAHFDDSIAADPKYAAAQAARARVFLTLGDEFTSQTAHDQMFDNALDAARRAVALAPALAEAQATLADTLATARLDLAGARAAYGLAMVTGGGQPDVLMRYGTFSCDIGDVGPGLEAVHRATTLDPLNPRAFATLGSALFAAGRTGESIQALRHALVLSPDYNLLHAHIGDALQRQGDLSGALAEYRRDPVGWVRHTGEAMVLHRLGDKAGASDALKALLADSNAVVFYQQTEILAQWGEIDQAFAALDAAFKARDGGLVMLKADPFLEPLHMDPRFEAAVRRLGLGV